MKPPIVYELTRPRSQSTSRITNIVQSITDSFRVEGYTKRSVLQRSPSSSDQVNDQNYDRDEQEDVDIRAEHVKSNEAEQPEHQQNNEYCPKHNRFLSG